MGDDRNTRGQYSSEHTDEDVIAAVRAHDPAATSEVAEELGIQRQSADYRLRKLRDEGRVNSKKIGASLVWFLPRRRGPEQGARGKPTDHVDSGSAEGAPIEAREPSQPDAGGADRREEPPVEPTLEDVPAGAEGREIDKVGEGEEETDGDPEPVDEELRDEIRANLPGSGDTLEARVDAVLDLYTYLREQEGQIRTTSELKELVDADDVGYGSVGSFWSNGVKANSNIGRDNALTALPGIEELGNGRYRYRVDE